MIDIHYIRRLNKVVQKDILLKNKETNEGENYD